MNTPKDHENTVNSYRIVEEHLAGSVEEDPKDYDLLKIVMIHLDADYELGDILNVECDDKDTEESLRMLNVLFSQNVSKGERKGILNDEFGVAMTGSIDEEVDYYV